MEKLSHSQKTETGGVFSSFQFLTLYFPAFILALGYSIATPAIPIIAKSFDTGFGVASLVIVVHALGGLIAAVPNKRHADTPCGEYSANRRSQQPAGAFGAHHATHLPTPLTAFTDVGDHRQPGLPPHFHRGAAEKAIAEKLGKALSHCRETR